MDSLSISPRDPDFVQDPYSTYAEARRRGPLLYWDAYGMPALFDAAGVQALLRDRRLGRAPLPERVQPWPDHIKDWGLTEDTSMLGMEPPQHTRLRGLVLRAFTSRRIAHLRPDIAEITDSLLRGLPKEQFDLIPAFCTQLPVRIIARLLGVPEEMWRELLGWSNAMVAMYMAGRTRATEEAANTAAREFTDFLRGYIEKRRNDPRDDLITQLIAAEQDGTRLSTDELIGTCILLLNAGHEATVHSLGNAVKCLLEQDTDQTALAPDRIEGTVEELLRYDPPLHMFTRIAYEEVEVAGHRLPRGTEIALMLGAAGRDPALWDSPERFDPFRPAVPHAAFGGGLHFCVGAPLARMELQMALPALFAHLPQMQLAEVPRYADSYHFHKLDRLMITP
ncbi:MAG: cytochrome P450 [Sulfitobacter sp.]|nr:cytochrome P450 [Sulfitobacter sp.]